MRLARIVAQVRLSTETIGMASTEITAGNLDLSRRTEQQAGSLEETVSAIEELTAAVKQNADNARQADQLATSASGMATEGGYQAITSVRSVTDFGKLMYLLVCKLIFVVWLAPTCFFTQATNSG